MREQMIIDGNLIDNPLPSSTEERAGVRSRKYYFDGGPVKIAAELLHELDADGNQPRVVKLTQQAVPAPNGGARVSRAVFSIGGRTQATERGIDFQQI